MKSTSAAFGNKGRLGYPRREAGSACFFYAPSRRADKGTSPRGHTTAVHPGPGCRQLGSPYVKYTAAPRLRPATPTCGTGQGVLAGERLTPELRAPGSATSTDLAGPARPRQPSGARTTMDVPELDSDWTGGAAKQWHPPRSPEDTGLGPSSRHPASVDRLGLDLQRRSRRSPMQHGGLITAATPSQVRLATTHTTLGPSKHPSVSRPTRAGPMPRRDQVNTSPAQRAHPRIAR